MKNAVQWSMVLGALLAIAGCHSDRPHDYGTERPPVDSLTEGDRGLQSKDLIAATDQMTQSLLAIPELNRGHNPRTIVAMPMENETTHTRAAYDIFIDRLKTSLSKESHGRVVLIENKARFHHMQNQELEGTRDTYGQGDGAAGPAGVQPEFFLYGKMQEMPNRATSTYRAEFDLTGTNRVQIWSDEYLVKVAR